MIICDKISKSYGTLKVIDSFSYTFQDTGFYLFLGESGSGKTTMLNILSGMIPFDDGCVTMNSVVHEHCVVLSNYGDLYDYITQDTYFIDYLTVKDNLRVLSDDEDKITEVLESFGLGKIADNAPSSLSGGERQRLALARTSLTSKKIVFFDEPTASLDKINKIKIFELLKKMSRSMLIICSSHDPEAVEYADEVIKFAKPIADSTDAVPSGDKRTNISRQRKSKPGEIRSLKKRKKLSKYVSKWFSSKTRGKKSDVLLFVFLTLAMCLCMLADTPTSKLYSNMEQVYEINSLRAKTTVDDTDYYSSLEGTHGIVDVVISYSSSVPEPTAENNDEGSENDSLYLDHETVLYAIPFDPKAFSLSDEIAAGTYFHDKNDIMLSSEMAEHISGGDINSLIGQTITVNLYGKGDLQVRIAGVFNELNDFQAQYLKSAGIPYASGEGYDKRNYENLFFLNSLLMDDYMSDTDFNMNDQRGYQLYFDDFDSMINYYETYDGSHGSIYMEPLSSNIEGAFTLMSVVLLPLAVIIMLLSVLFYSSLIGTELSYNSRFISVFNYSGYRINDVIYCFITKCIQRLLLICLASTVISFVITVVFNWVNLKIMFIGFQIFTYNVFLITAFICLMCISAILSINMFMRRVRVKSWYENLVSTRDLL